VIVSLGLIRLSLIQINNFGYFNKNLSFNISAPYPVTCSWMLNFVGDFGTPYTPLTMDQVNNCTTSLNVLDQVITQCGTISLNNVTTAYNFLVGRLAYGEYSADAYCSYDLPETTIEYLNIGTLQLFPGGVSSSSTISTECIPGVITGNCTSSASSAFKIPLLVLICCIILIFGF